MHSLTVRILDANDYPVSRGEIFKIKSFSSSYNLDEIGTFNMSIPLSDYGSYIDFQRGFRIVVYEDHNEIFRGIIEQKRKNRSDYTVSGSDLLRELTYIETGADYSTNSTSLITAITSVIGLVDNWTILPIIADYPTLAEFQGKSVFNTIKELLAQYGYHLRRKANTTRTLECGSFGNASDVIFTNASRVTKGNVIKLIASPEIIETHNEIVNRIIAYGGTYDNSGGSPTVLNMGEANIYPEYPMQSRVRGSTEYYIEDTASIALYGVRERVVPFTDIKPGNADFSTILNASNSLKSRAVNFLTLHTYPQTAYTLTVKALNNLQVGDTAQIDFEDGVNTRIQGDFYVTQISTSYSGERSYQLQVSDIKRIATTDIDLLTASLSQLQTLMLREIKV